MDFIPYLVKVDHSPDFPPQLLDYTCGTRTYNTQSGYKHAGTDFFCGPFRLTKWIAAM
jgi:hypothetical protein